MFRKTYMSYSFHQGFNSKNLTDSESQCVEKCTDKYMKLTQRVGFRFAEYQAIKQQSMFGGGK